MRQGKTTKMMSDRLRKAYFNTVNHYTCFPWDEGPDFPTLVLVFHIVVSNLVHTPVGYSMVKGLMLLNRDFFGNAAWMLTATRNRHIFVQSLIATHFRLPSLRYVAEAMALWESITPYEWHWDLLEGIGPYALYRYIMECHDDDVNCATVPTDLLHKALSFISSANSLRHFDSMMRC